MSTIHEIFGPRRYLGQVGIEIEVEGVNIPKDNFGNWKVEIDNSLRGEAREYITTKPLPLNTVEKNVQDLIDQFQNANAVVHKAHRGSVHMHINVQNYKVLDLYGLMFQWAIVEGLWMHLCGPTRESNLFCTPGASTGDLQEYAKRFLACVRKGSYHNFPMRGKYASLNYDPVIKYGSVEFRTFASTIDKDTLVQYANWCVNMVDVGVSTDLDNLTKAWKAVLENPVAHLARIFGPALAASLNPDMVKHFIEEGVERAAELTLVWASHKTMQKAVSGKAVTLAELAERARPDDWVVDDAANMGVRVEGNQFIFDEFGNLQAREVPLPPPPRQPLRWNIDPFNMGVNDAPQPRVIPRRRRPLAGL